MAHCQLVSACTLAAPPQVWTAAGQLVCPGGSHTRGAGTLDRCPPPVTIHVTSSGACFLSVSNGSPGSLAAVHLLVPLDPQFSRLGRGRGLEKK